MSCMPFVGLAGFLALPRKIVPIGEARAEPTGRFFTVLSPAQAAPGLAAQLALFAIGAFFLLLRLGHFLHPILFHASDRHLAFGPSPFERPVSKQSAAGSGKHD